MKLGPFELTHVLKPISLTVLGDILILQNGWWLTPTLEVAYMGYTGNFI